MDKGIAKAVDKCSFPGMVQEGFEEQINGIYGAICGTRAESTGETIDTFISLGIGQEGFEE